MKYSEAYPDDELSLREPADRDNSRSNRGARQVTFDSTRASRALFIFAAGVSFVLSVYLWFLVDREQGIFVGLWVPSILSLGSLLTNAKGSQS